MVIAMSLKGIFNKGDREEDEKKGRLELEKQIRRINTLEVHISRLLKIEARLGPLLLLKDQLEEAKKSPPVRETESSETFTTNEITLLTSEIEKLKRKVTKLEKEKREQSGSGVQDRGNNEPNCSPPFDELQIKIQGLETNLILVNRIQIDLLKQLESSREQWNRLQQRFNAFTEDGEQPVVQKEIYIDKLFLEKYEQNNNIAQVGIKELSGALNIGATYGTVPLPSKINATSKQEEDLDMEENTEEMDAAVEEEADGFTDIPIEGFSESSEDSSES